MATFLREGGTGVPPNMRAAVVHVATDAAVSVLVIVGLLLARLFGRVWMVPLAGLIGAVLRLDPGHGCDPARHESGSAVG